MQRFKPDIKKFKILLVYQYKNGKVFENIWQQMHF
jgi:hypothetical protein